MKLLLILLGMSCPAHAITNNNREFIKYCILSLQQNEPVDTKITMIRTFQQAIAPQSSGAKTIADFFEHNLAHGPETTLWKLAYKRKKTNDDAPPFDENLADTLASIFVAAHLELASRTKRNGQTPLHILVKRGDIETCKLLLAEDGIDVNAHNKSGMTPIMSLAERYRDENHFTIGQLLADHGADITARDSFGNTALHHACVNKHCYAFIKWLCKRMDTNSINKSGMSPMHLTSVTNDSIKMSKYGEPFE